MRKLTSTYSCYYNTTLQFLPPLPRDNIIVITLLLLQNQNLADVRLFGRCVESAAECQYKAEVATLYMYSLLTDLQEERDNTQSLVQETYQSYR